MREHTLAATAFFASPRFPTFLDQKPDNRKRPERVNPPRSKHSLSNEADHHDERQPAAGNALRGIRLHCAASKFIGKGDFAPSEIAHNGNGKHADSKAGDGELRALMLPQAPTRRYHHVGGKRE